VDCVYCLPIWVTVTTYTDIRADNSIRVTTREVKRLI